MSMKTLLTSAEFAIVTTIKVIIKYNLFTDIVRNA